MLPLLAMSLPLTSGTPSVTGGCMRQYSASAAAAACFRSSHWHPVCCREGPSGTDLHLQQRRFLAVGDEANATAEQPVWFVPLLLGRFSGQDDAGADMPDQQAGEAASSSVWLGLADSSTVLPPQASRPKP